MSANTTVKISRQDLRDLMMPPEAVVTNVKHLSSYNWVESSEPTIAVPGCPPLWSPPKGPLRVQKDSGHVYIDQNAARHQGSPLEALFRALYIANPSFHMRSVDLVTDRNNIRKLFSVINPESTKDGLKNFTISVELAGNTVLLCREEAETKAYIRPDEFRGFGHEFEKAYTKSRVSGSTGHHRIISYRFGNMKFIIRHETDGFVDADLKALADRQNPENDALSSRLATLSLSSRNNLKKAAGQGSKLRIREEGCVESRESTIEIKTRVATKPIGINEVAVQLWISQTPNLVRAYHKMGLFREPVVEDVGAHIKSWEQANQENLRKLAALINEILRIARGVGGRMILRYDRKADNFVVQKVDGGKMLPNDLYWRWNDMVKYGLQGAETASKSTEEAEPANGDKESQNQLGFGIPYEDAIAHANGKGVRQFFRRVPPKLSEYRLLCETLSSLQGFDVLEGRTLRDIMADISDEKEDWVPDEWRSVAGPKHVARDSAFRLVYMILAKTSVCDKNMVYNATLFVVSNRHVFKYRTRKIVREAFMACFDISDKQRKALDKWPVENSRSDLAQDVEQNTEEEEEENTSFNPDFSW